MKYKIVDNFIDDEDFDQISNTLTKHQEYYFSQSITGDAETENNLSGYGFGCSFVTEDKPGKYQNRRNTSLIQNINTKIMMRFGKEMGFRNVIRSRLDLTTHRGLERMMHPHTDSTSKNYTSILYFHTCGSPTIVYNETQSECDDPLTSDQVNNLTEMMRVDSVANRLFIFEGQYIHTGMCAYDTSVRVLLNSNFQ
tara:strand:+ start:401 stop:988 length:588 start_codon:yes stop_codon:yes gene_type:complete